MKRLVPALLALVLVSACSGGGSGPVDVAVPTPTLTPVLAPTSAAPCGVPASTPLVWPKEVPADLPKPPGATYTGVDRRNGLTIVRFTTPTSLRESVLFVVKELQAAGFTLGRGDAEPAEADAPFGRGDLRGIMKMLVRERCSTDWLVAVTRTRQVGTSPLLPTPSRAPGASPSPLPFG